MGFPSGVANPSTSGAPLGTGLRYAGANPSTDVAFNHQGVGYGAPDPLTAVSFNDRGVGYGVPDPSTAVAFNNQGVGYGPSTAVAFNDLGARYGVPGPSTAVAFNDQCGGYGVPGPSTAVAFNNQGVGYGVTDSLTAPLGRNTQGPLHGPLPVPPPDEPSHFVPVMELGVPDELVDAFCELSKWIGGHQLVYGMNCSYEDSQAALTLAVTHPTAEISHGLSKLYHHIRDNSSEVAAEKGRVAKGEKYFCFSSYYPLTTVVQLDAKALLMAYGMYAIHLETPALDQVSRCCSCLASFRCY